MSGEISVLTNLGVDGATVTRGYLCEETIFFGEVGGSSSSRVGEADL